MGKHSPTRIHWATIEKIIRDQKVGFITVADLTEKLKKEYGRPILPHELKKAIGQLVRHSRAVFVLGMVDGFPKQVLTLKDDSKRDSKRNQI